MIGTDEIRARILTALPGSAVEARDMTGTSDHYEVSVVSAAFKGLTRIEQHRIVYAALEDVLGGPLHALSLKTLVPGE